VAHGVLPDAPEAMYRMLTTLCSTLCTVATHQLPLIIIIIICARTQILHLHLRMPALPYPYLIPYDAPARHCYGR
jgi:hypothetical protein